MVLGRVGLRLAAQGRRWKGIRPGPAASFRTRPRMEGDSARSGCVFPHKAEDGRGFGQVGLRLSAQGRRWTGFRPGRAASFRTRPRMDGTSFGAGRRTQLETDWVAAIR